MDPGAFRFQQQSQVVMIKTSLPFYYKALDRKEDNGIPETFPFEAYVDRRLNFLIQKNSEELAALLQSIYESGSLLECSMTDDVGKVYGQIATDYIGKWIGSTSGLDVLEIGCGSGYVLNQLANEGARCVGLDPGTQITRITDERIETIRGFFPCSELDGRQFDLITHFFLLEHISDALSSIEEQKAHLKKGGAILFGVPNCEPFIENGDESIFFHEHYNYFTHEGIINLAKACDMKVRHTETSENNSMILACLENAPFEESALNNNLYRRFEYETFSAKNRENQQRIKGIIDEFGQTNVSVYSPARALNTLFGIGRTDCRLTDDNTNIHGKYLPGLGSPVESFESLATSPPRCILNFSRTFAVQIEKKCRENPNLANTEYFNAFEA